MTDALIKNKPREQAGRDTISRYKLQQKSTAIASLQLLSDQNIDYIYCDLHDDFVIRNKPSNNQSFTYSFYQVKTKSKKNAQWGTNDLCNIKEKATDKNMPTPETFKESFIGKLLLHALTFNEQCESLTFQTNLHSKDTVDELIHAIQNSELTNKHLKTILAIFNQAYTEYLTKPLSDQEILLKLQKLQLNTDVEYLKLNSDMFTAYCDKAIDQYAEISYTKSELEEILIKLLNLVEKKSSGIIYDWNQSNINEKAGISLNELLSILGISHSAYTAIKESSNSKPIKTTSILQRVLKNFEIEDETHILSMTKCKVLWDEWMLENRQSIPEIQLVAIEKNIQLTLKELSGQSISTIIEAAAPLAKKYDNINLTDQHILGAFLSEMVKSDI